MQVAGGTELASWAARGVGRAALRLGGFYAVQRLGGARLIERGFDALAHRWPATAPGSGIRLHRSLQAIYANRPATAAAFSLHELAWLLGALETWIALWLMGLPVNPPAALILERPTPALPSPAFPVPLVLALPPSGLLPPHTLFPLLPL